MPNDDLPTGDLPTTPATAPPGYPFLRAARVDGLRRPPAIAVDGLLAVCAMTPNAETVLQEAERIVGGERRQDYGGARGSFDRIALVWSAVLGGTVTGEQVALCMIGLKLVRESHAHKRDNVVDIAGYARCIEKMGDEA